ncbi:hypothetical protein ABPG72_017633 [Tetrahymena utriculariae]
MKEDKLISSNPQIFNDEFFDNFFHYIEDALQWNVVTKTGIVEVNGNATTFSALLYNNYYGCTSQIKQYADEKISVSFVIPHGVDLNLKFYSNNLGVKGKLGISNLQIDSVLCGNNRQFDISSFKCVCKSGNTEVIVNPENDNDDKNQKTYFTQNQLKAQIGTDANTYNCTRINQYFETMLYNASSTQNFTLESHAYVQIKNDAIFNNIQLISGQQVTKISQLEVNRNATTFQTQFSNNQYGCIKSYDKNFADGKTSVSLITPHTGDLTLKFYSNSLGSQARLGISNLQFNTYSCNKNTQFDTTSLKCVCKDGFIEAITYQGNKNNAYYEKVCVCKQSIYKQ